MCLSIQNIQILTRGTIVSIMTILALGAIDPFKFILDIIKHNMWNFSKFQSTNLRWAYVRLSRLSVSYRDKRFTILQKQEIVSN